MPSQLYLQQQPVIPIARTTARVDTTSGGGDHHDGTTMMYGVDSFSTSAITSGATGSSRSSRFVSMDVFRGLIMVVMCWDHTQEFLVPRGDPANSGSEMWSGPLKTYDHSIPEFLSRFVSHFCAPGFFLTMGIGMQLFTHSRMQRGTLPQCFSISDFLSCHARSAWCYLCKTCCSCCCRCCGTRSSTGSDSSTTSQTAQAIVLEHDQEDSVDEDVTTSLMATFVKLIRL